MHYPKYEMYEAKDILHITRNHLWSRFKKELKLPIFKTYDKYNNKKHQQIQECESLSVHDI